MALEVAAGTGDNRLGRQFGDTAIREVEDVLLSFLIVLGAVY